MKLKDPKPLVYVFCEGEESEIAYANFMKNKFRNVIRIKRPIHGLFNKAERELQHNCKISNYIDEINEVWFFFDVDKNTATDGSEEKWTQHIKTIKLIQNLPKQSTIKVRLLMTTGCIEYWMLLHYKKTRPPIQSVPDKDRIMNELRVEDEKYEKNNAEEINEIANKYYLQSVENGKWVLNDLKPDGLPKLGDANRDHWLYTCGKTFTTVHEALEYLIELENNSI